MPLDPKAIYIAQRQDDGSAWREVYISGSNLLLQTDSDGHLTGSTALPPSITVVSASYAGNAGYSVSSSYSLSSSFSAQSVSASYALTASFTKNVESASYANYAATTSLAISASYAISSSRAFLSNFSTYAVTASYVFSSEQSNNAISASYARTSSFALTASYVLGQSATSSYALTASLINNTGNTGSGYLIGLPVDTYYGPGTTGSIANIQSGDRVEDAFDKVENILFKLAPARPPNLSTKSLLLNGAYTANLQGTNTTISSVVTNNTLPSFPLVGGMVPTNAFSDGDQGQLTTSIDGIDVGSKILTSASDVGTYGALQITSDQDYYIGQPGKAGFWNALLAQIVTTTPITTVGPHTAQLRHNLTGNTPALTFYVDDPVTPTNVSASVVATGSVYISGVPALVGGVSGSSITLFATASNTVGRFYNSTRIFQGSGTGVTTNNFTSPSSPQSGSVVSGSRVFSINGGSQTENASFTVTAINSIGTSVGVTLSNTNIRMDSTLDPTNRVKSGFGQFGFDGTAFVTSQSIATAVEELQMLNGQFRYPTGNYTGSLPVPGPNYSSVTPGAYLNMRWVTLNMGSIVTKTNIRVDFSNTFGFSGALMTNFALYVRVNGSTPTNGWVDGNLAYPGTGNPMNDGDPAQSVADSTTTSKLVTFGTAVKTGTIYIRIGIPAGDTKRFGGITITAT